MFTLSFPFPSFLPLLLHAMFILMLAPLALVLLAHNWRARHLIPLRAISLVLISLISATAGAIGLSAAQHRASTFPVAAMALQSVLEFLLAATVLFVLRRVALSPAVTRLSRTFMPILNSAALLVVCELVSSLVPSSPVLLWSITALTSRAVSLFAIALLIHACFLASSQVPLDIEKEQPTQITSSPKMPPRVSSPTPGTWPFPASLAHSQTQARALASARDTANASRLLPSSTRDGVSERVNNYGKSNALLFSLALGMCQIIALLCAVVNIVLVVRVSHSNTSSASNGRSAIPAGLVSGLFIAHGVCLFLWAVMLLATMYFMPLELSMEALSAAETPKSPPHQTSSPSCTPNVLPPRPPRMASSDTASEFLSVPDPFASFPPPLPPPPSTPGGLGLGLDEVDVGWNRNKEIGVQYRFPAPRSKSSKGRDKSKSKKSHNISGKQPPELQGSAQTLISTLCTSVPSCSTGRETDEEKERALGDEALLAQMLLQSLSRVSQDEENRQDADEDYGVDAGAMIGTTASGTVHLPLTSRWSSSTMTRSTMTGSGSCSNPGSLMNRGSEVSCASSDREIREFRDRISMHTIVSRSSSLDERRGDGRPLSSATVVS